MAIEKENKVVHGNDLTMIGQQIKAYAVKKETGKGLSTNDYSDTDKTKLAGIAEGAQANVIEGVSVNGSAVTPSSKVVNITVPTKVSDLSNDSSFIDNTVNNLTNYYTKTQTYTKTEVDAAISAAMKGGYVAVATLPTASADTMGKIYLVPIDGGGSGNNVKEEYITIQNGSTYSWEMIGTTEIDLSNYVTKDELVALTQNEVITLLNLS